MNLLLDSVQSIFEILVHTVGRQRSAKPLDAIGPDKSNMKFEKGLMPAYSKNPPS
jgi:hypothetical protein